MICDPCKTAGVLNADANRVHDAASAEYLRNRALEAHGECPGRCACQHKVGQWLNDRA